MGVLSCSLMEDSLTDKIKKSEEKVKFHTFEWKDNGLEVQKFKATRKLIYHQRHLLNTLLTEDKEALAKLDKIVREEMKNELDLLLSAYESSRSDLELSRENVANLKKRLEQLKKQNNHSEDE